MGGQRFRRLRGILVRVGARVRHWVAKPRGADSALRRRFPVQTGKRPLHHLSATAWRFGYRALILQRINRVCAGASGRSSPTDRACADTIALLRDEVASGGRFDIAQHPRRFTAANPGSPLSRRPDPSLRRCADPNPNMKLSVKRIVMVADQRRSANCLVGIGFRFRAGSLIELVSLDSDRPSRTRSRPTMGDSSRRFHWKR